MSAFDLKNKFSTLIHRFCWEIHYTIHRKNRQLMGYAQSYPHYPQKSRINNTYFYIWLYIFFWWNYVFSERTNCVFIEVYFIIAEKMSMYKIKWTVFKNTKTKDQLTGCGAEKNSVIINRFAVELNYMKADCA